MYKAVLVISMLISGVFAQTYYDYFLQGNMHEDVKEYDQAIVAYKQCITLEPGFAPGYNGLGFVYLEEEDFNTASQYFDQATSLDEKFILPIINKGAAQYRQNKLAAAEILFLRVLALDPKNPRALTNMAAVKYRFGDYWGAWDYYNKAKAADELYLKERYNKDKTLAELKSQRKKDPGNFQLRLLEEKVEREEIFLP
jgi:tetratricopeptide (TPR) repeat protein